jgi:hypothetical protein
VLQRLQDVEKESVMMWGIMSQLSSSISRSVKGAPAAQTTPSPSVIGPPMTTMPSAADLLTTSTPLVADPLAIDPPTTDAPADGVQHTTHVSLASIVTRE